MCMELSKSKIILNNRGKLVLILATTCGDYIKHIYLN